MTNTYKITFSSFFLFTLLLGGMLLSGCDKTLSYEKASQMKPYSDIKDEEDRRWLYDYQMTKGGALMWLEEELYFLDDDVRFWTTSDGFIELEFQSEFDSYRIKPDAAYQLVQSKGAAQAAKEILVKARKKVGGKPTPPKQPTLPSAWDEKEARAQQLRRPKLARGVFLAANYKYREEAEMLFQKGNRDKGMEYLTLAIEDSVETLGEEDEETQKVLAIYQSITGRAYPGTSPVEIELPNAVNGAGQPGGAVQSNGTPQQDLARAAELLKQAGNAWRAGNKQASLNLAMQAYQLRNKHLGPDHPQTKEVENMIRAAQGE